MGVHGVPDVPMDWSHTVHHRCEKAEHRVLRHVARRIRIGIGEEKMDVQGCRILADLPIDGGWNAEDPRCHGPAQKLTTELSQKKDGPSHHSWHY